MRTPASSSAGHLVQELLGHGRYTFTREVAERRLGRGSRATYFALYRLVKAGWLVMPRSGFYVIVDPQHRVAGTLPPEWFVNDLMKHMERPYYVALALESRRTDPQGRQHATPSRGFSGAAGRQLCRRHRQAAAA